MPGRQSPIRKKMKNLRRQIRGRLLAGAPQNELERHMWEALGYQLLPTGDWCELEEPIGPSSGFIRRYPHGHVCKACLDHFRSTEYHDAFCQSCRSIMELTRKEIELVLDAAGDCSEEANWKVLRKVQKILECPRCFWHANEGRTELPDVDLIRKYLGDWIVAAHLHWMRHNFWNRSAIKPRNVSTEDWKAEVEQKQVFSELHDYGKKNPNIIEITYSETGVPLRAEQKHSKYISQFPPAR
jgi:hypothetical protein